MRLTVTNRKNISISFCRLHLPESPLFPAIRSFASPCYRQTAFMPSQAQVDANRANAQLSTGPTSDNGKAKSSLNAVKTGLAGRTVLLPGDDAALYEAHVARFVERFQAAGPEEQNLVQALADTEWRLARIPSLEAGIYALGRLELTELFPQEESAVRSQLIEAKIFLTYQRQLNNLSIQENRLRRQREKDTAALKELQEERRRKTKARLDKAAREYIVAVEEERNDDWEPEQFGFEFSLSQIEVRAIELKPDLFDAWYAEHPEELVA